MPSADCLNYLLFTLQTSSFLLLMQWKGGVHRDIERPFPAIEGVVYGIKGERIDHHGLNPSSLYSETLILFCNQSLN